MHDALIAPGFEDLGIAVPEGRDPEATGKIEVLAAVGVDDAASLSVSPNQAEPLRRGTNRPSVSAAM